jgi:ABC-2 type transport system permease protein
MGTSCRPGASGGAAVNWRVNGKVVGALLKRDLGMYFTNPTGYVFITLFIFLSAAAAFWQERFFLDNLANLDQLNVVFPYLLLLFVPALTMGVWSDERKQGTDELLLTLPATDFEVVIGKYLAALGIYTVALVLSFSHVLVLFWLGSPDLGLMLGNYLGYWLLGGARIAVGMLASELTPNATIAYILGAIFCGILVFVDSAAGVFSRDLGRFLEPLGVSGHFGDFARGVVTLSGLVYFVSVAGLMLYLNVLLIGRRHWPRAADGYPMWQHQLVRALALFVAVISFNAILGRAQLRLDVTAERLHALSPETRRLIGELLTDRPVFIQAFVSPQVPEPLVQTRANLLGLLREIDSVGGPRVEVAVHETEPFSEEARDAREKFGITPRRVPASGGARASFEDIFLGVAFTCGAEEQVIPFFERGYPAEYEVVRSIRVVARTGRKKIGVVTTAINLFGGMDFQTMRSTPSWGVVEELRKQYEVVQIQPGSEIADDVEGLMVALPSSLAQDGMDALGDAIESGIPTLLLVDPLPIVNLSLAPSERAGAQMNPFMRQQAPPPEPKGNVRDLLARLGVRWDSAAVVWDTYNPHPDLAHLPPEVVFVGAGNENPDAFNADELASSGLQELVLLYPGHLDEAAFSDRSFTPLVGSGPASGLFMYPQLVQRSFLGTQLNQNLRHQPDDRSFVLAARVTGHTGGEEGEGEEEGEEGEGTEEAEGAESEEEEELDLEDEAESAKANRRALDLVVIADLDFISEQFFQIRAVGPANLSFDNVSFFLNAMDGLLGDDSFIALRNRRVRHRTLERVEAQTQRFIEQRAADEKAAEGEAEQALEDAQKRLDEKVEAVRRRRDLDAQAKQIMARNLQEVENRRFETLKRNIEVDREAKIARAKETVEAKIRTIQSTIRTVAVLLPPIPVFVMGVVIFVRRYRREKEGAQAARRLRA